MIRVPTLTIPSGQTASNILDGHDVRWLDSLEIHPPAALSGVVTVRVAPQRPGFTPVFRDMESEGAVVVLTAGQTLTITKLGFGSLRLETTVAPGANEVYDLTGQEQPVG